MLKFSYKIDKSLIWWKATWDGKHNEKWYSADEHTPHPFSRVIEYESDGTLFVRVKEALDRTGKRSVKFSDLRQLDGTLPKKQKRKKGEQVPWSDTFSFTAADLKKLDPNNLRKYECVCALNPATLAMCKMLSAKETIHKHSGMTDRYWYWRSLLGCLSALWD